MSRWTHSWAYRKAKIAVRSLLDSPSKLLKLVEKAAEKSERKPASTGLVGQTLDSLKVLIRMVTAYARGDYREIAKDNLALIIAAVVYFVMPLDTLPDFIAFLGLTDDAALLAWTWSRVKSEVEKFLVWELAREKLVENELQSPKNSKPKDAE